MFDWKRFLQLAARQIPDSGPVRIHLGKMPPQEQFQWRKRSFCAFTTFDRLTFDLHYWHHELPLEDELGERSTADGGNWRQPFAYHALAHLIIPARFVEDLHWPGQQHSCWLETEQDIAGLSAILLGEGISHRLTEQVLEVKLY